MVTRRHGESSIGCLVSLLIVSAVIYFGINVSEVYWRYFEFRDDVRSAARFAGHFTDQQITTTLAAQADSLNLPDDASDILIRRGPNQITIESDYIERLEFPFFAHDVHFAARADGTF